MAIADALVAYGQGQGQQAEDDVIWMMHHKIETAKFTHQVKLLKYHKIKEIKL
jgi:hypothetical protein